MIEGTTVKCDGCGTTIAHVRPGSSGGWERLHNLCPKCFRDRAQQAV
jgi:ribosomal protein L32